MQKMLTATDKLQEYFNELMQFSDTAVTSQEEQILLAGAMMAVAKMLYHSNLSEQEYNNIMDHNGRDLLNLLKPTIH
jgi:hypothetical protein|tara:strand:- start:252 stop:482 length:231 start_codon:yes stop_codon:yes gene_type:complete